MRRLTVLLVALAALAGCGGSSGGDDGSPADVAPKGAVLYGQVELDPKGAEGRNVAALLRRIPGSGGLAERGTDLLGPSVSYPRDVKPWLGDEAAFVVTAFTSDVDGAAAIVQTKDAGKAEAFLKRRAKAIPAPPEKAGDATVYRLGDRTHGAMVDDRLVVGGRSAVRAVAEAAKSGDTLAKSKRFTGARRPPGGDGVAFLWSSNGAQLASLTSGSLRSFQGAPSRAVVHARRDGVDLDALAPKRLGLLGTSLLGTGGRGAGQAPSDATGAFGSANLGADVTPLLDAYGAVLGGSSAIGAYLAATAGIDLQRDLLDQLGEATYWFRGARTRDLDGALTVKVKDPATVRATLTKLRGVLARRGIRTTPTGDGFSLTPSGASRPIIVALRGRTLTAAYGQDAAAPTGPPLETDPRWAVARRAAPPGGELAGLLDMEKVLTLADAATPGAATGDFHRLRPYLAAFSALGVTTSDRGRDRLVRLHLAAR